MAPLAPSCNPLARRAMRASATIVSFSLFGSLAQAQGAPRVEITGHVAPRCWAAKLSLGEEPAIRCNYGRMPISVRFRSPKDQPASLAPRAEVEIVVSPTL